MRTRDHNWYDPKKNKTLYSFQVHHHGKWRHVAENGKPLLYATPGERNAKRREYRGKKSTDSNVAPQRDAYDTLNEQVQALRLQVPADVSRHVIAQTLSTAPTECMSCGPAGVYAADGAGPFDCYACGKKAGLADDELPGMWSGADLTGGKTDALPSPLSHPLAPAGGVHLTEVERKCLESVRSNSEYEAGDVYDTAPAMKDDEDAYWAYHTYWAIDKLLAAPSSPPPVDDAMVARAVAAYHAWYDKNEGGVGADDYAMHDALTAALSRENDDG